jgi:sec-independent protein translocase protein TatA
MFGMGMPELLVILVIALLVFGSKRLPEVGSSLGKAIRGFKGSMEEDPRQSDPAIPTTAPCPHCGQPAPREASFCSHCGSKLRQG